MISWKKIGKIVSKKLEKLVEIKKSIIIVNLEKSLKSSIKEKKNDDLDETKKLAGKLVQMDDELADPKMTLRDTRNLK